MTSSRHGPKPAAPAPVARDDSNASLALARSLSQLSLAQKPAAPRPPRRGSVAAANTPLQPPPLRSSSASPRPRNPSRSPSSGPGSRRTSCSGTPLLLRRASANSLRSASGNNNGSSRSLSRQASYGRLRSPSARMTPPEEEEPPATASSIANDYFRAELGALHGAAAAVATDTIVVLNDAVYGHRFSRPRTSRNALSTIVERPERIKASILGVSTAYVRLGGRHCHGDLPVDPKRDLGRVDSIPFRIHKTTRRLSLSSPAVTNVHGTRWMDELKLMCDSAESKLAMGGKELQRPDIPRGPDHPAPQKLHEGDLYLCAESLDAMEGALGAVCEAVDAVFGQGPRKAFVGVRPPGHHCSASHPSGFCWVNNAHVGIMHAALNHGLTHAAIIDFDLHHGDGSQSIAWEHNSRANAVGKAHAPWKKTSIGYFSLHDINSFPCEMGDEEKVKNASLCIDNAHGQTVWNVHLQPWETEDAFWNLYETVYSALLDKTRSYLRNQAQKLREASRQQPRAAIFLSAGFDASEWESSGMQRHHVNVPTEFYAKLTQDVVKLAEEEGLAVDGRVISVLEGGYSDRALCSGVLSHLSGMVGGARAAARQGHAARGLAHEMVQRIGVGGGGGGGDGGGGDGNPAPESQGPSTPYNPSWWASGSLDQLEQPAEPPSPPRKPRNSTPPTYSSPTQASTARVADPVRMRRSLSSMSTGHPRAVQLRPPSPPPPEVSWVVAAKELCNVLIPSDRQTDSCRPEDLNAEASRARRDRQSLLLGIPPPAPAAPDRTASRMSLRERRTKAIGLIDEETAGENTLPKTRRRQTAAAATTTTTTTPMASPIKASQAAGSHFGAQSARRPSGRLSGAPTALTPPREEVPPVPAVPATAPVPRRTTASRPTSRAGRTQSSDKLPVHKGRAASTRRESASRDATGARAASTPARTSQQQAVAAGADTPTPATGFPLAVAGDDPKADMEDITRGMKKIKINLITQSQREARQKAMEEANCKAERGKNVHVHVHVHDSETMVKPGRPPTAAAAAAAAASSSASTAPEEHRAPPSLRASQPRAPPTPSLSGDPTTPVEDSYPPSTPSPAPGQTVPAGSSLHMPHVAIQPASDAGRFSPPHPPEGLEPAAKRSSAYVPTPSAASPSLVTKRRQNSLFQYTSGIPFAPRSDENAARKRGASESTQPAGNAKPELKPTAHSLWPGPRPKT
ncbi:uncharacterized protein UV8b_01034 [Ustilaginoidea virens]|uniref:Histone deacetylase domain-containing protein n=2 Tax=Ustilaginoidea virens TaxID=1159556 RepID=A0A8E5HK60_USTVR|nr:uncharacterized protein UV8b_01034 [Ustilaginoidea virens]QUC16793.1 hypothetical protein UV8b_01034 [Ustilaginoidea virens]